MTLRAVLGFHSTFVIDCEFYTFSCQAFNYLLHCVKLRHVAVCHNTNSVCAHVLQVHSHFFCAAWSESNGTCRHFKSVLFLSGVVNWRGQAPSSFPEHGCAMMMIWIRVTRTGWRMC